jgi:transposase-like protein
LEAWVRGKVQEFVQAVLEEEVTEVLGRQRYERCDGVDAPVGHRNGYGKPRRLVLQTGTIAVRRPRVRGLEERFESRLLPLFVRRSEQVADLLPELYLHGLAQGDFELALRGLFGDGAPLSAKSIERLRAKFEAEYERWKTRPLDDRELVYAWADGIYVRAGLEQEKAALLVIIGAMRDGRKEVLAVVPGYRESTDSWCGVLRDLRDRGLSAPKLVVADGAAGVWAAATGVWPEAAAQRCWNHKIVNVLDQLPRTVQPKARELLTTIPYAPTRAEAERRRDTFAKTYGRTYPKAVAILVKDWERLVTFYAFPEGHWKHLRHDERDRVAVRSGAVADGCREAVQEGRERDGVDLADADRGRAPIPATQRTGTTRCGLRWEEIHGRETREGEATEGCRLILTIYTPLDPAPRCDARPSGRDCRSRTDRPP